MGFSVLVCVPWGLFLIAVKLSHKEAQFLVFWVRSDYFFPKIPKIVFPKGLPSRHSCQWWMKVPFCYSCINTDCSCSFYICTRLYIVRWYLVVVYVPVFKLIISLPVSDPHYGVSVFIGLWQYFFTSSLSNRSKTFHCVLLFFLHDREITWCLFQARVQLCQICIQKFKTI